MWPSVMAFCCGLLLCPSVMAFWCGLLVWPSGLVAFCLKVAFWYGLLVESGLLLWPSGKAFWCGGLLVERGSLLGETPQYNGQVGSMHPTGMIPPPPQQTATVADGTHPTGMHSCLKKELHKNFKKYTERVMSMRTYRLIHTIHKIWPSCLVLVVLLKASFNFSKISFRIVTPPVAETSIDKKTA